MNTIFNPVRVIANDPGITTGIAMGLITKERFYVTCEEEKLNENNMFELLEEWKPKYLVYETFEKRQNKEAVELFSRNLIGIYNLYAARSKCIINPQTPSYGKGHFTDAKLKKLDLYIPGRDHGRDALRHLLQWWTFKEGYQFNMGQKILLVRGHTIMEKAGV